MSKDNFRVGQTVYFNSEHVYTSIDWDIMEGVIESIEWVNGGRRYLIKVGDVTYERYSGALFWSSREESLKYKIKYVDDLIKRLNEVKKETEKELESDDGRGS